MQDFMAFEETWKNKIFALDLKISNSYCIPISEIDLLLKNSNLRTQPKFTWETYICYFLYPVVTQADWKVSIVSNPFMMGPKYRIVYKFKIICVFFFSMTSILD